MEVSGPSLLIESTDSVISYRTDDISINIAYHVHNNTNLFKGILCNIQLCAHTRRYIIHVIAITVEPVYILLYIVVNE